MWKNLLKIGAGIAAPFTGGASLAAMPMIEGIGAAAGAGSQASAANRGTRMQAMMDQDRMRMASADQQQDSERDILKKLAQSNYLAKGGANFKSTTPYNYSFAPQGASGAQMSAAGTMEQELLKRLKAGPMQLQNYGKEMNPGFWEKFSGILGAGASAYGAAANRGNQE